MTEQTPEASSLPNHKQEYRTPRLEVFGDLTTITRAVGNTAMTNDGGMGNVKTA